MPEKKTSQSKKNVDQFFKERVENKKKPRGENSFVAPSNNHTYQIDLFFMGYYNFDADADQKFRAGLVCIDVLSKFAVAIPIKSKDGPNVLEGTKKTLEKLGKRPKMIYTDDERAVAGEDFREYVEGEGIVLHRTRTHPVFAKRMMRTFKDVLFKRVEAHGKHRLDILLT